MKMKSRVLGHPLVMCMLAGAIAFVVAACGSGSSSTSSSAGSTSASSGATTSASSGATTSASGTSTVNPNNSNTASKQYGTVLFGSLPSPGTKAAGGTLSVGQITGQTPTYIFPIIPGADTSTQTIDLVQNLYMPLYDGPTGAEPKVDYALSFAKSAHRSRPITTRRTRSTSRRA